MEADDPKAHLDFPSVDSMRMAYVRAFPKSPVHECPRCHGHGGHNLEINAYPLRDGMEDTEANRHKFAHFRSSCSQCVGWGFVSNAKDAECVHVAGNETKISNCYYRYTCTKCGREWTVDSSD